MIELLEVIRSALANDVTEESRRAGAQACRTILASLEPPRVQQEPPPFNPAQIAGLVSALRGVPVDQLLDMAIAKMRAALPAGTSVPRVEPVKFQLIPVQSREKGSP
jgi:hypothetical protein